MRLFRKPGVCVGDVIRVCCSRAEEDGWVDGGDVSVAKGESAGNCFPLPFLALTSITDLTQWLRLQEICTPRVQIPDKSSVALYFAFLCTPQVQIPEKSLVPCNCLLPFLA